MIFDPVDSGGNSAQIRQIRSKEKGSSGRGIDRNGEDGHNRKIEAFERRLDEERQGESGMSEFETIIQRERENLGKGMHNPMARLSDRLGLCWGDAAKMASELREGLGGVPYASRVIALNLEGERVGPIITKTGEQEGKSDWREVPWFQETMPPWGFLLSAPHKVGDGLGITALHRVSHGAEHVGFVAATLNLSDLPSIREQIGEVGQIKEWSQIKGDPSIRAGLFRQTREPNAMDAGLPSAVLILGDLIMRRGMFQAVIHFSGSRATGWFMSDPHRYVLLDSKALTDPHRVLAFPLAEYPKDAEMPKDKVLEVINRMALLRMSDETIYLRSASVNIFNGLVSLTFSCDGTHYVPYKDFLDEKSGFWMAAGPLERSLPGLNLERRREARANADASAPKTPKGP